MDTVDIEGRIIRIVSSRTVIVNLGFRDGVGKGSAVRVLGAPEMVVDPKTGEELGEVSVVKAALLADQVEPNFTICVAKPKPTPSVWQRSGLAVDTDPESGDLHVLERDMQPWASSKEYVKVGDAVAVTVDAARVPPVKEDEIPF